MPDKKKPKTITTINVTYKIAKSDYGSDKTQTFKLKNYTQYNEEANNVKCS